MLIYNNHLKCSVCKFVIQNVVLHNYPRWLLTFVPQLPIYLAKFKNRKIVFKSRKEYKQPNNVFQVSTNVSPTLVKTVERVQTTILSTYALVRQGMLEWTAKEVGYVSMIHTFHIDNVLFCIFNLNYKMYFLAGRAFLFYHEPCCMYIIRVAIDNSLIRNSVNSWLSPWSSAKRRNMSFNRKVIGFRPIKYHCVCGRTVSNTI